MASGLLCAIRKPNVPVNLRHFREHLLPAAENDEKFRHYMGRISWPGLEILAAVEIGAPILLEVGRMAVNRAEAVGGEALWRVAAVVGTGVATLAVSRTSFSRAHARLLVALSAWFAAALLAWFGLAGPASAATTDDYILAGLTLITLTAVATAPLLPWHTLALGLSVEGVYILSAWLHGGWEITSGLPHENAHEVFLFLLTLLATGISVSNYQHRRAEFLAGEEAVRAAEALTGAQLRAQLAENAISIGKMAAALSHEINSPVGALRSSIETLLAVTDRQRSQTNANPEVLEQARADLSRSIRQSAARIEEVTLRLRRFVMLEEAELKQADVNDLLADVALLHQDDIARAHVNIDFQLEKPMPPLACRPQLLTAVFSNLLSNALQAVNGDGHIEIATRRVDGAVEVSFRDNGRGMSPEQASTVFEPSFKVEGGRISSGNWSLFNSRQIVYEHGGDITLDTQQGRGTFVSVTLPLSEVGISAVSRSLPVAD
jgi:signal transduction histidine kinase